MFDIFKMKIAKFLLKNSFDNNKFTRWFGEADWEDNDPYNLSNMYNTHAYVNIAVSKIAQNIVRAKMEVKSGENVLTNGPTYNLFRDVNPYMSRAQLLEATMSWLLTRGECIWVLTGSTPGTITGIPEEIYVYDPQYFKEYIGTENNKIVMWEYERDSVKIPFNTTEIIHFYQWNPYNQFRGMNPLIAQSSELQEDSLISKSNIALMKNHSVPAGVLTSDEPLTEPQAKELLDMWNKTHGGGSKKGKTAILGHGTKYQHIGMTSAEMEFFKSKKWNRTTILGKYGVPAMVAGFKDDETPLSGNDSKEQLKYFWENTILSHLRFLEDKLETEFSARFDPTVKIKFNVDDIPELQEDAQKRDERIRLDVAAGILTQNEGRDIRGLDPVSWGDVWWKPISLSSVEEPKPEKDTKLSLFNSFHNTYTEIYKSAHWWMVRNKCEGFEIKLKTALKDWMQAQRASVLEAMANSNGTSIFKEFNDKYWEKQKNDLRKISNAIITEVSINTIEDTKAVLKDISIDDKYLDYIQDAAAERDNEIIKLYDAIFNYLKDNIKSGDIDDVREKYKIAQARLTDISHIEIGRIVNKVRMRVYEAVGITHHMWLAAKVDSKVSDISALDNNIDGEVVKIGDKFSNGIRYPMEDISKSFDLTLPIIMKETL